MNSNDTMLETKLENLVKGKIIIEVITRSGKSYRGTVSFTDNYHNLYMKKDNGRKILIQWQGVESIEELMRWNFLENKFEPFPEEKVM